MTKASWLCSIELHQQGGSVDVHYFTVQEVTRPRMENLLWQLEVTCMYARQADSEFLTCRDSRLNATHLIKLDSITSARHPTIIKDNGA